MATPEQLTRFARNQSAAHRRDVPKARRARVQLGPVRPMIDPRSTLGHPARTRKLRRKR